MNNNSRRRPRQPRRPSFVSIRRHDAEESVLRCFDKTICQYINAKFLAQQFH